MKRLIFLLLCVVALRGFAEMPKFDGTDSGQQLLKASLTGDIAKVKALLKDGADPNYHHYENDWSWYPLVLASGEGHLEIVKMLVKAGADVNICHYWSPLYGAAQGGHLEVVEYLVSEGAIMNIVSQRLQTLLMTAAAEGHEDVVDFFLSHWWASQYVFTWADAAWWSAYSGKLSILKKVEAKGHPINMKSTSGDTILTFVLNMAKDPSIEIIRYILDKGTVDLSSINADGETALQIAQRKGYAEAARLVQAAINHHR